MAQRSFAHELGQIPGFSVRNSPNYRDVLARLQRAGFQIRRVTPAALGKQRSRDTRDDPYLACALAARAEFVITRDADLLDLEKPFGVEMVTPRTFLDRLRAGL